MSNSNSNVADYAGSKNLVQTRQKFQVIKLDFSNSIFKILVQIHTAGSDNIFVQIYMDALPGVPGLSKKSTAVRLKT